MAESDRRRFLKAIGIGGVTSIAGCTGTGDGGTDPQAEQQSESATTTALDSTTTTERTSTTSAESDSSASAESDATDTTAADLPEGVTASGFSPNAVVENHLAALYSDDYGFHWLEEVDNRGATQAADVQIRSSLDSTRLLHTASHTRDGETVRSGTAYRKEDTLYARQTSDGSTSYSSEPADRPFDEAHRSTHEGNYVGTLNLVEALGLGTYVLDGTRTHLGEDVLAFALEEVGDDVQVTSADVTVLISHAGIIHLIDSKTTFELDEGTATNHLTYEVTALGDVSIDDPAWLDET